MEWEPSTAAALIGAGIGGLSAVVGQIVAVLLRQRGERRHQNRLLLEKTYTEAVGYVAEANRLAAGGMRERPGLVGDLQGVYASVLAVGSPVVARGLSKQLAWLMTELQHRSEGEGQMARTGQNGAAGDKAIDWGEWTIMVIRHHLRVKDARAVRRIQRKEPES